ncbi:hypothetical protein O3G_MSEX006903 [Manduca sexta]|uniref:Uncharacterized protein n=1 Tax=Manduca sexta TaxID=7130 RepID=A0A922CLW7_MANSE|nr:hypothetical protein O3G_MSEX006903 [Manduca sexta]
MKEEMFANNSEAVPTSEATIKSGSEFLHQKIADSKAEKANPKGEATPSAFIKGATKILKYILKIPIDKEITPEYSLLPRPPLPHTHKNLISKKQNKSGKRRGHPAKPSAGRRAAKPHI